MRKTVPILGMLHLPFVRSGGKQREICHSKIAALWTKPAVSMKISHRLNAKGDIPGPEISWRYAGLPHGQPAVVANCADCVDHLALVSHLRIPSFNDDSMPQDIQCVNIRYTIDIRILVG